MMICGRCGTPIRRGERFDVDFDANVQHVLCPVIRIVVAGETTRQREPDLLITLRTPPEAS